MLVQIKNYIRFHLIYLKIFFFQFIIVSLKDGMFNNANVLFKTKFIDGTSTVTRYAQGKNNPSTSRSK